MPADPQGVACAACRSAKTKLYCRASDIEYFTTSDVFSYWECETCGALTIDPMPTERLTEIYPPNYYSYAPGELSLVARVKNTLDRFAYARILKSLRSPRVRVLDIGGGYGQTLDILRATDPRVTDTTVVDIDAEARTAADTRGHTFVLGAFGEAQIEGPFDLVLMLNFIEHVADPVAALRKAGELLEKDGLLVVQTPNYRSFDATLFRNRSWGGLHCPRHWVLFDRDSFAKCCESASLQTQSFKYTQGAPFWAWSIMNELRRLGFVKYDSVKPVVYHPLTKILMALFAAVDLTRGVFARTSQMIWVLKRDDHKHLTTERASER